ncbi:MAG: efflux transporter outer membrane subunit, partial [Comamonas sp.]
EQVALQRHRIAALMGASPERAAQIEVPAQVLNQPWQQAWALPENLPANLLGRRPDVVAARLQAQALESRVAAKQAEFYPDVNLTAFVGVQSLGLDLFTKGGSSIASVGPAISLPIFNGGRLRSELGAARAQYDEAVALYRSTLNRALQEVADNAVSQRALQQQLQAMKEAVQAATEAHRVARNRYEGGLANYLEVLSAEDQMLASVRQLVDVQSRALSLDIGLHRALGGGWQADASQG